MLRFLFRSSGNEEKEQEPKKALVSQANQASALPGKAPPSDATVQAAPPPSTSPPASSSPTSLGNGSMARTAAANMGSPSVSDAAISTTAPLESSPLPGLATPSAPRPQDRLGEVTLFKNLLAALYDAILIFDNKGFLVAHNPRAEQYFGYSAQELWGMRCADLVTGMDERMLYKIRSATSSGRFTVIMGKGRRRDGTTFPAEIAINRSRILNEGDLIFAVHSLERQEKLREKQAQKEAAVLGTTVGLAVCELGGKISYANPAFLQLARLAEMPEVGERTIGEFCSPPEAAAALLQPPPPPGMWIGRLQFRGFGMTTGVPVLASSVLFEEGKGGSRLVVSLFPLPLGAEGA